MANQGIDPAADSDTDTDTDVDSAGSIRRIVPPGAHWTGLIRSGRHFRITDLEGNQAVDTIFYNASDPADRYSADRTIQAQRSLYLTTGSTLYSTRGTALVTIVDDTCGRHDTLGGACSRESNTMRYGRDTEPMHACRDSFIQGLQALGGTHGTRDITCNVNFFMNVPVTPDGRLTFEDGISAAGRHVEMRACTDVFVLVSNCPQLNNPCNGWNPTPIEVWIFDRDDEDARRS